MLGIELRARREALGLTQRLLAADLGNAQATVSQWETGVRAIPADVEQRIRDLEERMESLVSDAVDALEALDGAGQEGAVLHVWADDAAFWAAHPDLDGTPAVVHRVAMARAAAEVEPAGLQVRLVTP